MFIAGKTAKTPIDVSPMNKGRAIVVLDKKKEFPKGNKVPGTQLGQRMHCNVQFRCSNTNNYAISLVIICVMHLQL